MFSNKIYQCDRCEEEFPVQSQLAAHRIVHAEEAPLQCNICNKHFLKRLDFYSHLKEHTPSEAERQKKLAIADELLKSQAKSAAAAASREAAASPVNVLRGQQPNHGMNFSIFPITQPIKMELANQDCLFPVEHMLPPEFGANQVQGPYTLSSPAIKAEKLTDWVRGMDQSGPRASSERPYQCNQCDKNYIQRSHLMQHLASHITEKNYKCMQCTKAFATGKQLKRHMTTHVIGKTFRCEECAECFVSAVNLKTHMGRHTGERPFKCDVCDKSYLRAAHLKQHKRRHANDKPYHCQVCGKSFFTSTQLARHLKIHTNIRAYQCDKCEQSFHVPADLRIHMRRHTGERPYVCDICGKSYLRPSHLKQHKRLHSGEKPYACQHCPKAFVTSTQLARHGKTHTREKQFPCNKCKESFFSMEDLVVHVRRHNGERPYKCDQCERTYIRRSHLVFHRKLHSDKRPYQCQHCRKAFITWTQMARHIKTHTSARPHHCFECGRSFLTAEDLVIHTRRHTGERPFQCEYCEKSYTRASHLVNHKKLQHAEEKRHRCQQCNQTFYSALELTLHIDTHAAERPYKCDICNQAYTQFDYLNYHKQLHHNIRAPYEQPMNFIQCDECDFTFASTSQLQRHKKFHTRERPYRCDQCGKSFLTEEYVVYHIRTFHKFDHMSSSSSFPSERPEMESNIHNGKYACARMDCILTKHVEDFPKDIDVRPGNHSEQHQKSSSQLISRSQNVAHIGEKPYKCDKCGKGFRFRTALRMHVKIHRFEKSHQCGKCKKSFLTRSKLKQHRKERHSSPDIDYRPYGADDNVYSQTSNPNYHSKHRHLSNTFHGQGYGSYESELLHKQRSAGNRCYNASKYFMRRRSFRCPYCMKGFRCRAMLVGHTKHHSAQTPYSCSVCTQAFPRGYTMYQHKKLHNRKNRNPMKEFSRTPSRSHTVGGTYPFKDASLIGASRALQSNAWSGVAGAAPEKGAKLGVGTGRSFQPGVWGANPGLVPLKGAPMSIGPGQYFQPNPWGGGPGPSSDKGANIGAGAGPSFQANPWGADPALYFSAMSSGGQSVAKFSPLLS